MSSVHEEEQDNLVTIFFVVGHHIATRTSAVTGNRSGLAKRFHGVRQPCRRSTCRVEEEERQAVRAKCESAFLTLSTNSLSLFLFHPARGSPARILDCLAPSMEPLRKTTAITCHCRGPCGYMMMTPMPAYEFFSRFLAWKYFGRLAEVAGRRGNRILTGSRKILLDLLDFWNRSKKDCGSEEKRFFETCWCIPTDTGTKIQFLKLAQDKAGN